MAESLGCEIFQSKFYTKEELFLYKWWNMTKAAWNNCYIIKFVIKSPLMEREILISSLLINNWCFSSTWEDLKIAGFMREYILFANHIRSVWSFLKNGWCRGKFCKI